MAVKIRLRRMGAKKAPFYRVVVADSRAPRDGRSIDETRILQSDHGTGHSENRRRKSPLLVGQKVRNLPTRFATCSKEKGF